MSEIEIFYTKEPLVIMGYTLEGGGMCPEQYDVTKDGKQVAYLRLRHGRFTATVPDGGGCKVYQAHPSGDGGFEDDERMKYLTEAITAVDRHIKGES